MSVFGSPEEFVAALQEKEAHRQMHLQDDVHRTNEFLANLDDDQLERLDDIIHYATKSEGYAGYVRGQVAMLREQKFNVCRCGVNHAAEAEAALKGMGEQVIPDEPEKQDFTDDEKMNELGLEWFTPLPKGGQEFPSYLRCARCHKRYVSIEDRAMVRECLGCHDMDANGGFQG